jgi:glutamate racemase
VIRHGSAELVELAEAKLRGTPVDLVRYRAVLGGLFGRPGGERIDVVVLACTHFPLVEAELAAAAPRPVRFVDGAAGIARRIAFLAGDAAWPDRAPPGIAVFTRLGDAERALAPAFAERGFPDFEAL